MPFTINPSWSNEVTSGALDYYTVKAVSEGLVEAALIPVSPLIATGLGVQSYFIDPLLAAGTGGVYKLLGRKETLVTPKAFTGNSNQERSGAMAGAVIGNLLTAFLPIPFANTVAIMGGQYVGKKVLRDAFSPKTTYF